MPVPILFNYLPKIYSGRYYVQIAVALLALAVVRAYAQGRNTSRERDLHARVILLTGAFTSAGATILEALAQRGAHVIALTDQPIEAPEVTLIIEAVRDLTKNERVFVERCDFLSVDSVRAFCTKFLTGKEHRLDAIVYAHEYQHLGPVFASEAEKAACEEHRAALSDGTFLMTTLLLPTLLVAPAERDIRIINLVNPFYAAAAASQSFPAPPSTAASQFLREGYRALRTVILARHLQRVLDALPQAPAPDPDNTTTATTSWGAQKSNIVSISISPGFSRHDTIAPLLRAESTMPGFSRLCFFIYILLQPLLRILAKTPSHAIQSVLHALFLPTPFKHLAVNDPSTRDINSAPEEILKPGALYSDCSIVRINLRNCIDSTKVPEAKQPDASETQIADDGEYGGEAMGRLIWESFEESLKNREKRAKDMSSSSSTDKKSQ